MSASLLFIIGVVIFAITVYGVVMAGGLMLTRRELDQNADLMRGVAQVDLESPLPIGLKY
jgi:hypothetical protein